MPVACRGADRAGNGRNDAWVQHLWKQAVDTRSRDQVRESSGACEQNRRVEKSDLGVHGAAEEPGKTKALLTWLA